MILFVDFLTTGSRTQEPDTEHHTPLSASQASRTRSHATSRARCYSNVDRMPDDWGQPIAGSVMDSFNEDSDESNLPIIVKRGDLGQKPIIGFWPRSPLIDFLLLQ